MNQGQEYYTSQPATSDKDTTTSTTSYRGCDTTCPFYNKAAALEYTLTKKTGGQYCIGKSFQDNQKSQQSPKDSQKTKQESKKARKQSPQRKDQTK